MNRTKKVIRFSCILLVIGFLPFGTSSSLSQEDIIKPKNIEQFSQKQASKSLNCINENIAQRMQRIPGVRQPVRAVELQISESAQQVMGGEQLRITSFAGRRTFTVSSSNGTEVRKLVVTRSSNLKRASFQYTSPFGVATFKKEGLRVVSDTFDEKPRLRQDYLRFQDSLYSQIQAQEPRLAILAQSPQSTVQPSPSPTTRPSASPLINDLATVVKPDNDIKCEKNPDGKCECDCNHGWNPFGLGVCLGFVLGCDGDFIEFTCPAPSSRC